MCPNVSKFYREGISPDCLTAKLKVPDSKYYQLIENDELRIN